MHQLRAHQAELKTRLDRWRSDDHLKILAYVVPGGGKSWLPAIVAERFPKYKLGWFVPRVTLRSQAAESMESLGITIWESENDPNPSRGTRGFVATHSALTSMPELYVHEFERHPYIVVFDEVHHAKRTRAGKSNELASVIPSLKCPVRMDLTGTLETNDNSFIQGVTYDEMSGGWRPRPEKSADIYIRYDRRTAISENSLVPIEFYHHDGPVRFIGKNGAVTRVLSDPR